MSDELSTESLPTEPALEGAIPSPKEDPQASARFAALAKQRKQIFREQQSFKAERDEFEKKRQDHARERQEYDDWKRSKEQARENPNDYLSKGGLSYEDLVNYQLNGGKPTPELEIKSVKEEIAALKREHAEALKRAQDEARSKQEEDTKAQMENWKRSVRESIAAKNDDFELINELDYHDYVPAAIEKKFQEALSEWRENGEDGEQPMPMSAEDAAKELEAQLRETVERLLTKTKAFSGKYSKIEQLVAAAKPGAAPPSRTLSSSHAPSSAPSVSPAKSGADRIARAAAAMDAIMKKT